MTEEALFNQAAGLPLAERIALLDRECANRPELRQRVEALLMAREEEESNKLTAAHVGIPAGTTETLHAPPMAEVTIAGRYTLIERIGEGGMGEVWVARQSEPVKRKVALKLIKAGMDSRAVLQRFEAERQALAMMDHPNIAKVLDGGLTAERQPFFVMELVNGLPLTKFCDEAKLTPRQRLELFVPICQAVQHAHQKGIVHRDLKPSNILVTIVDGAGVPKVIDFGVAKATSGKLTDDTLSTQFGGVVGTLEYMAPEQAGYSGQDIDTRADIYSLGVVLYELLTGLKPHDGKRLKQAAYTEMLRIIQEEEPSKPSTRLSTNDVLPSVAALRQTDPKKLTAMLRGELDWIVMKCLEKQRHRRYESANGLARDIQRYLADEPVEARPASLGYRASKFIRRNRMLVIAASLVLLALVGGIIGTTWGLVRADRNRKLAEENERAALAERDAKHKALLAETQARQAEQKARNHAMTALRAMTDEIVENQMARQGQLSETNKSFLRQIIKYYEGFAEVSADDAESLAIRSEGHHRVAMMRERLGDLAGAEQAYSEALALRKKLVADFPNNADYRRELAHTQNNVGALFSLSGRLPDAEAAYNAAVALRQQLVAEQPSDPVARRDLSGSQYNFGLLYFNTGRFPEAEAIFREAMAIQRALVAEVPSDSEYRHNLAATLNSMGYLHYQTNRKKEAADCMTESMTIRKQLAEEFPENPAVQRELGMIYTNLGLVYREVHGTKEAETAHNEALAVYRKLAANYPTRADFREGLALSHNNLGMIYRATDRRRDAENAYAAAIGVQKQLLAENPDNSRWQNDLAATYVNLAFLCIQHRDYAAAKAHLQEAHPHHRAALKLNPRQPTYRQYYRNNLWSLTRANAGLLDQDAAMNAARAIRDLGWDPPWNAYDAAIGLINCVAIVEKHKQLDDERRQAAVEFYRDGALAMLREAISKGFKDAEVLKKEQLHKQLSARQDYQKLLAELEAKPESKR